MLDNRAAIAHLAPAMRLWGRLLCNFCVIWPHRICKTILKRQPKSHQLHNVIALQFVSNIESQQCEPSLRAAYTRIPMYPVIHLYIWLHATVASGHQNTDVYYVIRPTTFMYMTNDGDAPRLDSSILGTSACRV